MRNEHSNRTRKAIAIADRLQAVDCDADTAARLTDSVWQQAAQAAAIVYAEQHPNERAPEWTDASDATRAMVIALLADRDRGRFERADSLHPTGRRSAAAHDVMSDVIAAYLADPEPPVHCTEHVPGDPAGCARCGEAEDLHPCTAGEATCDHPFVAYCDECDPDPQIRQHEEATGIR